MAQKVAPAVVRGAGMLLGTVWPSVKQNAARVKVRRMILDTNLNMYFNEFEYVFAHDPNKLAKTGDVVLIKKLPEKLTTLIAYKVEEVVYPLGDVTCPITGKKVVGGRYRDQIDEETKLYGKSENAFDHTNPQPRGRLEGTRDFTHRPVYIRWHDDGTEDPQAF